MSVGINGPNGDKVLVKTPNQRRLSVRTPLSLPIKTMW